MARRAALMPWGLLFVLVVPPVSAQAPRNLEGSGRVVHEFPAGKLPVSNPKTSEEILTDFRWGIHQMRMQQVKELEALAGHLTLTRLLDVDGELLGGYYVLEMASTPGVPFVDALMAKSGYLWSVADVRTGPRRLAPDLPVIVAQLTTLFGPTTAKYYFAGNNIEPGGSRYVPLIAADTPKGRLYVNSSLDLYEEESFQPWSGDRRLESSNLGVKRRGEQWLVKDRGIAKIVKIGSLGPHSP